MRMRVLAESLPKTPEKIAGAPSHGEFERMLRPRGEMPATKPAAWVWTRLTRWDVVVCAALFTAAILVRWPLIERGETLLHSDEAIVGIMAQDIAAGRSLPVFFYGQRYMGALEAYVVAGLLGFVDRPITALRLAPAMFFAAMVSAQYLMLTRWRGRGCGLAAALVLLAGAPMFAQWSISARGGYIEILLWGTLLLWAYSEWWIRTVAGPTAMQRFLFGVLIGSGLWINPSIVIFVAPIALHALLAGPMRTLRSSASVDRALQQLGTLALPIFVLGAALALNLVQTVHVENGKVVSQVLLGLLPKPLAIAVQGLAAGAAMSYAQLRWNALAIARRALGTNGPLLFGIIVGVIPIIYYVAGGALGTHAIEPALPLGFRPLWKIGETAGFLANGLPLLLGASSDRFLQLICIGREDVLRPINEMTAGLMQFANWLVAGGLVTLAAALVLQNRRGLASWLRLEPSRGSPVTLLVSGMCGLAALYLMSGCAHDFNTIRYLIPMWAFLPGLIACAAVGKGDGEPSSHVVAARAAFVTILFGWSIGQFGLWQRLGAEHPLRPLANELRREGITSAQAELFDAHILSYLTEQRCKVSEFQPFWPRLGHYRSKPSGGAGARYLVRGATRNWADAWAASGFPGTAPPETDSNLAPAIAQHLATDPGCLIRRLPLACGFELIDLKQPLAESNASMAP